MIHAALLVALLSMTSDATGSVSSKMPSIAVPHGSHLDKIRFIVFYRTPLPPAEAAAFFQSEMTAAGWSSAEPLNFFKDDFTVSIILDRADALTHITINMMKDLPRSIMGADAKIEKEVDDTAGVAGTLPSVAVPPDATFEKVRFELFYDSPAKGKPLVDFFLEQFKTGRWKLSTDSPPKKHDDGSTEIWADHGEFGGYVAAPARGGRALFVSIYAEEAHSIMERQ